MKQQKRIVLTGFMGAGKSTVARCLAYILQTNNVDLDQFIERNEGKNPSEIITHSGEAEFRRLETLYLQKLLTETEAPVISLGGGAWIYERNRQIIKLAGCTSVWLETTFEHCWRNIAFSRQARPLARDKQRAEQLFYERRKLYCLADWHFVIRPDFTSHDVAEKIAEEVLG